MITYKDELLMHYGIKGQKKGRRRFQNPDGSLTAAGRLRYLDQSSGKSSGSFIKVQEGSNRPKNAIGSSVVANSKPVTASGANLSRQTKRYPESVDAMKSNTIIPSEVDRTQIGKIAEVPTSGSKVNGNDIVVIKSDSKNVYERYFRPDGSIDEWAHPKDGSPSTRRTWSRDGTMVEDGVVTKGSRSRVLDNSQQVNNAVSAAVNTASKLAQQQATDKIESAANIYKKTLSSVGVHDSKKSTPNLTNTSATATKKKVSDVVTEKRIKKAAQAVQNVRSKALGPFLSKKKKTAKKSGGGRKDEIK